VCIQQCFAAYGMSMAANGMGSCPGSVPASVAASSRSRTPGVLAAGGGRGRGAALAAVGAAGAATAGAAGARGRCGRARGRAARAGGGGGRRGAVGGCARCDRRPHLRRWHRRGGPGTSLCQRGHCRLVVIKCEMLRCVRIHGAGAWPAGAAPGPAEDAAGTALLATWRPTRRRRVST